MLVLVDGCFNCRITVMGLSLIWNLLIPDPNMFASFAMFMIFSCVGNRIFGLFALRITLIFEVPVFVKKSLGIQHALLGCWFCYHLETKKPFGVKCTSFGLSRTSKCS